MSEANFEKAKLREFPKCYMNRCLMSCFASMLETFTNMRWMTRKNTIVFTQSSPSTAYLKLIFLSLRNFCFFHSQSVTRLIPARSELGLTLSVQGKLTLMVSSEKTCPLDGVGARCRFSPLLPTSVSRYFPVATCNIKAVASRNYAAPSCCSFVRSFASSAPLAFLFLLPCHVYTYKQPSGPNYAWNCTTYFLWM